jgi:uncharacterized caspase-like protein
MGNKLFKEDQRMALIIACSNYDDCERYESLPWVENDANSMKEFLESIDFEIIEAIDEDLADVKKKY